MSELKIESTSESFESDSHIREYVEHNVEKIQELLENIDTKLGDGRTANVHFLDSNRELCLKVLRNAEEMPDIFYLRPEGEMSFLNELQGLDSGVRVPKPYFTADYDGVKCLAMETLQAHTLIEIINGEGKLPENFNADDFYGKLKNFLEKMHEKNIYHRDLHAGNIMINPDNGQIYVIDFGGSTRAYGEDDPYMQRRMEKTFTYTKDEVNLNTAYRALKQHLLTNRE